MFQEELDKLRLRLADAQEQLSLAERNHQTLSERYVEATDRAEAAETLTAKQAATIDNLMSQLSASRRAAETNAKQEQDLLDERDNSKKTLTALDKVTVDAEKSRKKANDLAADLAETRAELIAANEQVEPLKKLVAALRSREQADKAISSEIAKLRLDG